MRPQVQKPPARRHRYAGGNRKRRRRSATSDTLIDCGIAAASYTSTGHHYGQADRPPNTRNARQNGQTNSKCGRPADTLSPTPAGHHRGKPEPSRQTEMSVAKRPSLAHRGKPHGYRRTASAPTAPPAGGHSGADTPPMPAKAELRPEPASGPHRTERRTAGEYPHSPPGVQTDSANLPPDLRGATTPPSARATSSGSTSTVPACWNWGKPSGAPSRASAKSPPGRPRKAK